MSENQEAQILAQWLDGVPGGTVPESLDSDVAETVFALRPEYAPAPAVTIEAVLASLTDGPLVDPAIGEALRSWLEAGPGTPPPDILPIGVVEAFYALRPDMAPAPSVGIEEILNSVTEGPFAPATPSAELIDFPASTNTGDTAASTEFNKAEPARKRAHRRWWTAPSLTVAAVAATTIFFVGPMSDRASEGPPSQTRDYVPAAPSAVADEPQLHSVTYEEAEEEDATARVPEMAPNAATMPSTRAKPTKRAERAKRRGATRASAPPMATMPAAAPPPAIQKEVAAWEPAEPTSGRMGRGEAGSVGSKGGQSIDFEGAMEDQALEAPPPLAVERKRKTSRSRASRWFQGGSGGTAATDSIGAIDAQPERSSFSAAEDEEMEVAEKMAEEEVSADGDLEPAPPTYRGEPRIHATEAQARSLFAEGKHEKALEQVNVALKLKSNSPFTKARLLRLKADILMNLGRETDAQQARAEAARMDPTR